MITETEIQIAMGSDWLEARSGCNCPKCAANRPRVLNMILGLRGIVLVGLEPEFGPIVLEACCLKPPTEEAA